jgi:hypothetical protein
MSIATAAASAKKNAGGKPPAFASTVALLAAY